MANNDNLKPLTTEKAREIGRLGGIKSGEVRRNKRLMKQIYLDFLISEHDIKLKDGTVQKINTTEYLNKVMKMILQRGDSASVSLLRELRETIDGRAKTQQDDTNDKLDGLAETLKAFLSDK